LVKNQDGSKNIGLLVPVRANALYGAVIEESIESFFYESLTFFRIGKWKF
jgi:hypothetical protein